MNRLMLKCLQCNTITEYNWCFNNKIILSASKCKKCSQDITIIPPTEKTENIITHPDFLPYGHEYCDAFVLDELVGDFHYYQMSKRNIQLPVLLLNKTENYRLRNGRRFDVDSDGIVLLEDIINYLNMLHLYGEFK